MELPLDVRAQQGVVTRAQLLAAGVPASTIGTWLRRSKLVRLLPQVYLAGPPEPLTRVQAALLWLPRAAASHRTAAWLYDMLPEPELVEVTVPRDCSRPSPEPWLRLYRRDLPRDATMRHGRLPVVVPERAVLDCMGVLGDNAAGRLVDTALARLVRPGRLRRHYVHNLGRHGNSAAYRQLVRAVPGAASHPERVLARALRRAGLAGFGVNQPVRGYVADLLHRELRLIIEVDGWSTHGGREAFQRDRTRQNVLVAAGHAVLRYTADDIAYRLPAVVREVTAVMAARRQRRAG